MSGARRRIRAWIGGRVQGVWFRRSTFDCAKALGLGGCVRNLPDGRVEAVFEGPPAAVERALEFVRRGPPAARVSSVEVEELEPTGESDFRVA